MEELVVLIADGEEDWWGCALVKDYKLELPIHPEDASCAHCNLEVCWASFDTPKYAKVNRPPLSILEAKNGKTIRIARLS
jgi:hypothetical protein